MSWETDYLEEDGHREDTSTGNGRSTHAGRYTGDPGGGGEVTEMPRWWEKLPPELCSPQPEFTLRGRVRCVGGTSSSHPALTGW